jgi:hypothetical protein
VDEEQRLSATLVDVVVAEAVDRGVFVAEAVVLGQWGAPV